MYEAVAIKQDFETREVKVWFRPEDKDATSAQVEARTGAVLADMEREHDALDKAVRAAYAPVTYTLKVTLL